MDIILAARMLVAKQGVHATSMRAIALEAGVTTGAVTHHFESKAHVMASVLRHNLRAISMRIVARTAGLHGLSALEAAVESLLPLDEPSREIWTVQMAFWGHAPARRFDAPEKDRFGYRELRDFVVKLLVEAEARGEIRPDSDHAHEAERILAIVGGLGLMAGALPVSVEAMRALALRMLRDLVDSIEAIR